MKETQRDFGLVECGGCAPPVLMELDPVNLRYELARFDDVPLETGEGEASPYVAKFDPNTDAVQPAPPSKSGGTRNNAGKPQVSLIIPGFILEMAKVLTFGALKYARDNWMKGLPLASIHDSLQRHAMQALSGIDNDEETGCAHEAHIAVNAMFAWWMRTNRPDLNNLLVRPAK